MSNNAQQKSARHTSNSSLDMTMDIYTHVNESQQREMMDAFDRFLEGDLG